MVQAVQKFYERTRKRQGAVQCGHHCHSTATHRHHHDDNVGVDNAEDDRNVWFTPIET